MLSWKEELNKKGFALGASEENTLIYTDNGILNKMRFPDEAVRHKIMDLLGELYLYKPIPIGRYFVFRGGHLLHFQLIKEIKRLDDDTAMSLGRELLGFPKKMAEIDVEVGEDSARAIVRRRGVDLLAIRANLGEPIAEMKNKKAQVTRTFFRPRWSFSQPAARQPSTHPAKALDAAHPLAADERKNRASMYSMAPEMTAVS